MRLSLAFLIASLLPAVAEEAVTNLADGINVIVHDAIITKIEVYNQAYLAAEELRRQYRNDREAYDKRVEQLREEITDSLVEKQLILRDFEKSGLKLPESVIDDYVQQQIRERYPDRATFNKTLQAEGSTYERFRKQTRERFIVQQMNYLHVGEALVISPHKIETYYVQHTNDFKVTEKVKLRMIMLPKTPGEDPGQTRKLAEEILSRIHDGAKFADMASVYSQGAESSRGGERDWEEAAPLQHELAEAVARLKPGGLSDVIETPGAFYLVRVEDVRPEHIQPLSEVRSKIEDILLTDERNRLQKQWIERLKKKTFVRYL